jgi:hypothetical protein
MNGNHPIEVLLKPHHYEIITKFARQKPHNKLSYITNNDLTATTTESLRELLSHGSMILDNVLNVVLEILCTAKVINYLSTYFNTLLRMERNRLCLKRWIALSKSKRRVHKPMINDPVILIPCHLNTNHSVAVVRRIIQRRVHFFYADDLNQSTTEQTLKQLLIRETDTKFYPLNAVWVKCPSTTFQPHSNKCGPRTLLALTVMGLHPNPHANMLLPYMSANLAQILCTWVAATVLTGEFTFPEDSLISHSSSVLQQRSEPADLFQWNVCTLTTTAPRRPLYSRSTTNTSDIIIFQEEYTNKVRMKSESERFHSQHGEQNHQTLLQMNPIASLNTPPIIPNAQNS